MTREDDRTYGLKWIRSQELSQFRLFRLLRRRRAERGDPPRGDSSPRTDPPSSPGGG